MGIRGFQNSFLESANLGSLPFVKGKDWTLRVYRLRPYHVGFEKVLGLGFKGVGFWGVGA